MGESFLLLSALALLSRSAPLDSGALSTALAVLCLAVLAVCIPLRSEQGPRALRGAAAALIAVVLVRVFTAATPLPEVAAPATLLAALALAPETRSHARRGLLAAFFLPSFGPAFSSYRCCSRSAPCS